MQVFRQISDVRLKGDTCVTIGTFDGIHRGHRAIIEYLLGAAERQKLASLLVTFEPHPRKVLQADKEVQILSTTEEKLHLLEDFGLDYVLVLPFDVETAAMSYQDFLQKILLSYLKMKVLVMGYDHGFGRGREGTVQNLRGLSHKFGFELISVPPFKLNGQLVKSSLIRHLLKEGDIETSNFYLGHPYYLQGEVIRGSGKGREIDFPTANLKSADESKMLPRDGAYAVDILMEGKKYKGMMNIGFKPTFNHSSKRSVEVHIFDTHMDLYGKTLGVYVRRYLRPEMRFNDMQSLRKQLLKDKYESLKE